MTVRVATDIGGTFTDLVAFDDESGAVTVAKASTTPSDLPAGVLAAVGAAGIPLDEVTTLVHGTTVVINALTERRGARTALVTTRGFRDVLEIGRGNRPDMYNLVSRKPLPFVPRRHRFEVEERVDRDGNVLVPLRVEDIEPVVAACRRDRIEAIAVCLLHSYAHPAHERRIGDALRAALPDVPVTISSDITREWREFERSSTAVLNAYVQPVVDRYLGALDAELGRARLGGPVRIVQSAGGTVSLVTARRRPIGLVESGPAAGVIGAARLGERIGERNVLYLDIGGTTAKCSLIEDGEPKTTTEYHIDRRPDSAGYPILTPVVDVVEIGAGGGSIAALDEGGSVRVGPRSAGAVPGPACYDRGGVDPTVTDAKLAAGVLDPDYFLGGRVRLRADLAERALARLGESIDAGPAEVANGIIRLVNANMISALKLVSVRRGYDPRDFVLVAAGGGGPMHAAALAAELHVRRVVVPPYSGVFSAWGMALGRPRADAARTRVIPAAAAGAAQLDGVFRSLEDEVVRALAADGVAAGDVRCERSADMRYRGQEHAVRVPVRPGAVAVAAVVADFHALHRQKYTFDLEGEPAEIVTCHVAGFGTARPWPPVPAPPALGGPPRPKGSRRVDFDADGIHEALVHDRASLPRGFHARGPLVVEDETTTVVVRPGQALDVDEHANLVISLP
jgi:N-methylhydantoinase A